VRSETPRARSLRASWRGYGAALLLAGASVGVSAVLLPLTDEPTYAPLVGAATVAGWYAGVGAGVVVIVVAWPLALFAIAPPRTSFSVDGDELSRLLVALAVALVILWLTWVIHRLRRRAEKSTSSAEALQELAASLSAAAEPSRVANALVLTVPGLLGATGGSLGLVEGDDLVIVDPAGAPRQALPPGMRLPLATPAILATAAREGRPVYVNSRRAFEEQYPDGALLAPASASALAVPLRARGEVVGAMSFMFAAPGSVDGDTVDLALVAADLGGHALERARLYAAEQQLRESFEHVAQLAPLFAAAEADQVPAAICAEALTTFDADAAQIWTVDGDHLEVLVREPPSEYFRKGTRVEAGDFVGLDRVLGRLETFFVPDAQTASSGLALELIRRTGIRSILRVPIVVGGRAESVLGLVWHRVIPEPGQQTLALARRFGDHAGLALEQAARRRAQEVAARNAEQARRLLSTTAALAAAMTVDEVAQATVNEVVRSLHASGATVARVLGSSLQVLATTGAEPDEQVVGPTGRLAQAIARSEMLLPDGSEEARGSVLAVPLTVGARAVGGLALAFPPDRRATAPELDYLDALARQAGQALERALLLEEEQTARRRAEQMAGDLAQLHALSTAMGAAPAVGEVVRLVCAHVSSVADADSAGIYRLGGAGEFELLDAIGTQSEEVGQNFARIPVEAGRPLGDAVVERRPIWLLDDESWAAYPVDLAWRDAGVTCAGVIPLVVEERAIGALFVSFEGGRIPNDAERRLIETMARLAAQPLERLQLLQRERTARLEAEEATRMSRLMQTVAQRLATAVSPADVAAVVVSDAIGALGADASVVYGLDEAREDARLLASEGFGEDLLASWRSIPLRVSSPVTDVIREGEPLVFESSAALRERYPFVEHAAGPDGDESSYCFPLRAAGRMLGAVYFSFFTPRVLDEDALATARAVFRQCALALDRAQLFEDELLSRQRTEQLQSLTAALSGALTPDEVASVFLDDVRTSLAADGAAFAVVDQDAQELRTVGWRAYENEVVEDWLNDPRTGCVPATSALHVRRPVYVDGESNAATQPELLAAVHRTGHRAFAIAPIGFGAAPLGVAVFSWRDRPRINRGERAFIEALTSQGGLALDRARQYESERMIAETLQRSVLPETLPSMQGVQVAVRYLPGTSALDVGGDWFDTITLRDGSLGFVVGDVVGKGVRAAATMAQLRNGMRAITLDAISPGESVTKLNRLVSEYTDSPFATMAYVCLDPVSHRTTLVSAGHLPPLVIDPLGGVTLLEGGRGLPLGVDPELEYEEWETTIEAGSTIVLYTDGLVERRDRPLDVGLELLAAAAADAPPDPNGLVDRLVEALLGTGTLGDDVAVLAVKLDEALLRPLDLILPAESEALPVLRRELERWLERAAIPQTDARDVVLATWEAGTNAIEHAQDASDQLVRVRAELIGDRLHVEVVDTGRWKTPESRPDRGLGLQLIEALMTFVDIDRSETGTRVVMERSLTRERVGGNGVGARER
jgi:GAF domain-containing protein/anti-sigma regulatory factor (Ser/Thr protein kinase)